MKDDEELEMLLREIPHAISLNLSNIHHHHKHGHGAGRGDHHNHDMPFMSQKSNGIMYGGSMVGGMYKDDDIVSHNHNNKHTSCASPMSGFFLQSDGSSSSLFSNGSPTTPPLEERKSHLGSYPNRSRMELKTPDSTENVIDEISLSRTLDRVHIGDQPEDVHLGLNDRRQFFDHSSNGTKIIGFDLEQQGLPDYGTSYQFSITGNPLNFYDVGPGMVEFRNQYRRGTLLGSPYSYSSSRGDELFSNLTSVNGGAVNSQFSLPKGQASHHYQMGVTVSNLFGTLARPSAADVLFCGRRSGTNVFPENVTFGMPQSTENLFHYHQPMATAYNSFPLHVRMPNRSLEGLSREDRLIIQGDLNYVMKKGYGCSKGNNDKGSSYEASVSAQGKRLDACTQIAGNQEGSRSLRTCCTLSLPSKCNSLVEARGYIYYMAKDQHGCRFLQRMFDEGTPQDVQVIFNEIIDHVIELMMNPFGNYLMQKLLEVCNEEQRMEILLRVTAKPGELIRISLNTHGTRVVQKLIEMLKSKQQISLVISALEPGFLALIKDLNGNHVVQRCLQCLSSEDSKFIFVAAAKYCVDIATHQHGCCVLQRCIGHSTGEHRENLIAEISANGLLLAQDAFGNYVVQFILELKIPSATTKLVSQFDGNYVHLSTQKFSSHVVEKCLLVCNKEVQSKVIHELLSACHFEQLLQDPHANYVVQTALKVPERPLHNLLVAAIESHKVISRNSPYSKRIFSHKLLKK